MRVPIDLIVDFRVPESKNKQETRDNALQAEKQYNSLLQTLNNAGLSAVGKVGERAGKIMICVEAPSSLVSRLIQKERQSDFVHGLPTVSPSDLGNGVSTAEVQTLDASTRARLLYAYLSSTVADGGLGISKDTPEWSMVDSITCLHDRKFNDAWLLSWTTHLTGGMPLETVRKQYGDAVALYFAFLTTYAVWLIFPSAVGIGFWYSGRAFSLTYSIVLLIWSTTFVEYWKIREHIIALRWGTAGAKSVELRRHTYKTGAAWWLTEVRYSASTPVILLFAVILTGVLTSIFVIEAFVTHLYTGPGHQYVSFAPTILFTGLIPNILAIYQKYAVSFTKWENHEHQSSYDASLTRKTFALSAIVAYLGLSLSAFVYVPFGNEVMGYVQGLITASSDDAAKITHSEGIKKVWITDAASASTQLNPTRLQTQMYAYTVTNQLINMFLEIGLPYVMRTVEKITAKVKGGEIQKKLHARSSSDGKKRVLFNDDDGPSGSDDKSKEEREFLEKIRSEVAKPEFSLFTEYSEMVTQFGYIALWSNIWTLAPLCALVNNIIELRSDAVKLTQHVRRPIPQRLDTIGPWLDCLTFLTWLSALSNAALVYLFEPRANIEDGLVKDGTILDKGGLHRSTLLSHAAIIALCASHGFIILRAVIKYFLHRILDTDGEVDRVREADREVKEMYIKQVANVTSTSLSKVEEPSDVKAFWEADQGLDEVRRAVKDS